MGFVSFVNSISVSSVLCELCIPPPRFPGFWESDCNSVELSCDICLKKLVPVVDG